MASSSNTCTMSRSLAALVLAHATSAATKLPASVAPIPTVPSLLFVLVDDVGWADYSYNGGVALTPNIDAWATRAGTVLLQDFHSGGANCAPTRASVLTGRNPFRDCMNHVYDCSDPTECLPTGWCYGITSDYTNITYNHTSCHFAPGSTWTVGDAIGASQYAADFSRFFVGKWHLGR